MIWVTLGNGGGGTQESFTEKTFELALKNDFKAEEESSKLLASSHRTDLREQNRSWRELRKKQGGPTKLGCSYCLG